MLKDLLVPMTKTAGDANALETAIALASREDAHLCVLETIDLPVPTPGPWGLVPDLAVNDLYGTLRETAQRNAERLRERLRRETLSSEVRIAESLLIDSAGTAAVHGRYCDMAVMTGATDDSRDGLTVQDFFSSLLLDSGRPVLVIPARCTAQRPVRRAVVAWRGTREASRALHDALPLLRQAESVDLVEIESRDTARTDREGGAAIAGHLARHGLKVRLVSLPPEHETVATALIRHADQEGADLLIAGGYGHTRFREWALGGVTRELLQFGPMPMLFAH